MRVINVEGREAIMALTPEDCLRMAMACYHATDAVHGKLSPDEADRANNWFEAMEALFEFAAMATGAWSFMPVKSMEKFTLEKIREGGVLDPLW